MSRTDLIGDCFTIIRNAIMARKDAVDIPSSKIIIAILQILKKEKYIENFKTLENKRQGLARVYLKYIANKPAIRIIKRVSRPGLRVYVGKDRVPLILRGRGIAIISTSKGILTDTEARKYGIGGEVIGYVW